MTPFSPMTSLRNFVPNHSEFTHPRPKTSPPRSKEERECYCHKFGHVISECLTLKRKQQPSSQNFRQPKGVGLIKMAPAPGSDRQMHHDQDVLDPCFRPFISKGLVSLTGDQKDQCTVQILRDTGASQSFILSDVLPLSEKSSCGSSVLVQGIEMGFVPAPLHCIHVQSELVTGFFKVGVRPSLQVKGISFIMGNYLAGGHVNAVLEVLDHPDTDSLPDDLSQNFPEVFSASVVTRAQLKKRGDEIDLSDCFCFSFCQGGVAGSNFWHRWQTTHS